MEGQHILHRHSVCVYDVHNCMLRAAGNFATHLTAAQSRADRLVWAVSVRVLILGGDLSTEAHGAPAGPTVSKRHVSEWPQRRIIPRGALDREQRASVEDARGFIPGCTREAFGERSGSDEDSKSV